MGVSGNCSLRLPSLIAQWLKITKLGIKEPATDILHFLYQVAPLYCEDKHGRLLSHVPVSEVVLLAWQTGINNKEQSPKKRSTQSLYLTLQSLPNRLH